MRWPYVSREVLDAERAATERLIAHHQRENERLAALVEALRAELSAVLTRVTTQATAPDATPVPRQEPSALAQVIREEAAGDPRLAAHYWKLAGELRRADKTEPEIIEHIRTWVTVGDPLDFATAGGGI